MFLEYGVNRRARLYLLPTGMLRISIPGRFRWSPGQHVFVRFLTLGVNSLAAHPFTICSLAESGQIVLYVRVRGGITARLAALARKQPGTSVRVLLDGPYGGMQEQSLARFDNAVIVSGGSGAGFTLPLVENVLRQSCLRGREPQMTTGENGESSIGNRTSFLDKHLHVILATRNESIQEWYANELNNMLRTYDLHRTSKYLHLKIHATGEAHPVDLHSSIPLGDSDEASELGHARKESTASVTSATSPWIKTARGRPDLPNQIYQGTTTTTSNGPCTVGIAVCGPPSMLQDVRNATAAAQARILAGTSGVVKEVYLHTEHFE